MNVTDVNLLLPIFNIPHLNAIIRAIEELLKYNGFYRKNSIKVTLLSVAMHSEMLNRKITLLSKQLISPKLYGLSKNSKKDGQSRDIYIAMFLASQILVQRFLMI